MRSLSFNFLTGRSTAEMIVRETCAALWEILQPIYVRFPQTAQEWKKIATDMLVEWNFPNCIGCIDGKHVSIECPANSGSRNFNYKKSFSTDLMATCDAHYRALVDLAVRLQCPDSNNDTTYPLTACLETSLSHQPNLCPLDSTSAIRGKAREPGGAASETLACALKCACFCYPDDPGSVDAPVGNCLVSDHRLLGCGDSYCVTISKTSHLAILCDEQSTPPCRLRCHETRLVPGKPFTQSRGDCLRSLSKGVVWGFLLLRLLAIVFSGVAVTLTDAVARLVHDDPTLDRASTDQHRLWGSAGWGAASLLMGQLNHWKSSDGGAFINFSPGVYLSTSMNALDVVAIILLRMPLRETPSRRLFESEPSSYRKRRTYFYMALTYVVGSLSGAIWVFGPLRLRLLGAASPLIAVTSAVQVRACAACNSTSYSDVRSHCSSRRARVL
ncbi:hypothetical protein V5799_006995 [Amblyomma americanum]|uniref:DDE Tnp4 domain-containing protein n=1 Tax=Amblyomma americanum TaxID=6943 RepID=A0AAQ4DUT5_AMBAM